MLRLIAVAAFALSIATSAQGMSPAPLPQPDNMVTQVAAGCGPGRTMVNGVCVARTTIHQTPGRRPPVRAMASRHLRRVRVNEPNWRPSSRIGRQLRFQMIDVHGRYKPGILTDRRQL